MEDVVAKDTRLRSRAIAGSLIRMARALLIRSGAIDEAAVLDEVLERMASADAIGPG